MSIQHLVESTPNIILCLLSEREILEFNAEEERLYGRNKSEVMGENYIELFVPREHRKATAADIEKILAGEPTRGFENPVMGHDGSERMLSLNVNRPVDLQGEPISLLSPAPPFLTG